MDWVRVQHETVTLRFQIDDNCHLIKESVREVSAAGRPTATIHQSDTTMDTHAVTTAPVESVTISTTSTKTAETTTTTTTTSTAAHVKQIVKESHWRISANHSLMAFTGNNGPTDHSLLISQREASADTVQIGGRHEDIIDTNDASAGPIPSHTNHTPCDIDLTWFVRHMRKYR